MSTDLHTGTVSATRYWAGEHGARCQITLCTGQYVSITPEEACRLALALWASFSGGRRPLRRTAGALDG